MKILRIILAISLLPLAGSAQRSPARKLQRLLLQKKQITLKSPSDYSKRLLGVDPKTGQEKYYDPKPEVTLLNEKSGLYELKWIGYDGQEKTVVYQRPDAIDAVVSATVSRLTSGDYLYTYTIRNLPSSGQHLKIFALQTFVSDVKPHKVGNTYIGPMSRNRVMKEGDWIGFVLISDFERLANPGKLAEFKLESAFPPGLVECRVAGGEQGMKGVGEDMPQELENVLPGYEAWPSGYTIGPDVRLKTISKADRAKYVLKLLSQFKRLGWMTPGSVRWYEQKLSRVDLEATYKRAAQDLKTGHITVEVFAIIEGLINQP